MRGAMTRSIKGVFAVLAAAAIVFAASCTTLPQINPDLAQPSKPVVLDGPGRPLSAEQSKAILAKLEQGGKSTGIFERHLALEEQITGSPLTAGLAVLLLWWLGDRFTFRLFPDPLRFLGRWRRMSQLRTTLGVNPHDRRARFELAERLLEGGRPRQAAEVLRPNIEAGDEDAHTAFVMGAALGRTGAHEQAERALALAREEDPRYRAGEIDLELGRQRVARGDWAAAREAHERLLVERPGSVEGRYLLGRALSGMGDEPAARKVRELVRAGAESPGRQGGPGLYPPGDHRPERGHCGGL